MQEQKKHNQKDRILRAKKVQVQEEEKQVLAVERIPSQKEERGHNHKEKWKPKFKEEDLLKKDKVQAKEDQILQKKQELKEP